MVLAVALQGLFALQIAGLVHGLANLKGQIGELRLHGRGNVWVPSIANEHLQSELDVQIGRVLGEHGLETDEVIAGSSSSEEEMVILPTLLTNNSMASRILRKGAKES